MTKNYTTKTASIKATNIDTYRIDAKKITINGEPLDINSESLKSAIVIKDERETITENDIWPNPINAEVEHLTSNTDGNIVYQGLTNNTFDYSEMTDTHKNITKTAVKVIDNKVLGSNDELLMNWDTKSFTNSNNSDMNSIFGGSPTITEWDSDLSSLTNGEGMFYYCTALASFDSDLSSLTNGEGMFAYTALASFDSDLSKLTDGSYMFYGTALTSWNIALSSLTNGSEMFQGCKLDPQSVMIIAKSIRDITTEKNSASDVGQLTIGINVTNSSSRLQKFAEAEYYDSWDALEADFTNKGWTVTWEFNGIESLIYNDCITVEDCATVNSEYAYDVDENGEWNHRLDNLENANQMFVVGMNEETGAPIGSTALVSFNADLPKVTTGQMTFVGCSNLTTFNGDLSNLSDGSVMFGGCPKLKSFTSDLSSLTTGAFMFGANYETAERFVCDVILGIGDVDISELPPEAIAQIEQIINMVLQMYGPPTSLDLASVQNIADTINDITGITPPADLDPEIAAMWGRIDIGIDPTIKGNSVIEAALTTIRNKGWDVTPMEGIDILKYNDCVTYLDCREINPDVATDVAGGAWIYRLDNLETSGVFDLKAQTLDGLFTGSQELKSFNVDLPKLTDGSCMFTYCAALESFNSDLSSLENGSAMFAFTALESFNSDLSKLTNGYCMFLYCSALTSFDSNLSSLTDGTQMFINCKLNTASVQNIANTINDLTGKTNDGTEGWGQITIGIQEALQDTPELETALAAIVAKGWTVQEMYA